MFLAQILFWFHPICVDQSTFGLQIEKRNTIYVYEQAPIVQMWFIYEQAPIVHMIKRMVWWALTHLPTGRCIFKSYSSLDLECIILYFIPLTLPVRLFFSGGWWFSWDGLLTYPHIWKKDSKCLLCMDFKDHIWIGFLLISTPNLIRQKLNVALVDSSLRFYSSYRSIRPESVWGKGEIRMSRRLVSYRPNILIFYAEARVK